MLTLDELVPPHAAGLLLEKAELVGDRLLVLVYLKDACAAVVFTNARTGHAIGSSDAHGTRDHASTKPPTDVPVPVEEIDTTTRPPHSAIIPLHASISAIACRSDSEDFYLAIDSYVSPPYVLTGKVSQHASDMEVKMSRLDAIESQVGDIVCEQAFYPSYDGTLIPLFICHRRDLDLSKPQPTLLYAYGGSGMCLTPHYNPLFTTYMRHLQGM
jgi:prolyl oligopeptidase